MSLIPEGCFLGCIRDGAIDEFIKKLSTNDEFPPSDESVAFVLKIQHNF